MLSVSSDPVASLSFQTAPPRTQSDPSQTSASFGALVDSNTPADPVPSAPTPLPASPRRADDSASSADNTQSADTAASDQAARNTDARDATAQQASDANAAASADANTAAVQRSQAKSNTAKAGDAKSADKKTISDSSSAPDPAAAVQQIATTLPVLNPVAVSIPVGALVTAAAAATPTTSNGTAPLAIAAAAIAASSASSAAATAGAQTKITSDAIAVTGNAATPAAAVTAAITPDQGTGSAAAAAAAATAKIADQTNGKTDTKTAATATPIAAADAAALTVAVAATVPVAPKPAPVKAGTTALATNAAPASLDGATAVSNPATAATPVAATAGPLAPSPAATPAKKSADDPIEPAKADLNTSATNLATAVVPAHDHSAASPATSGVSNGPETGIQAGSALAPQTPAAAVTAAPAGPLTVTIDPNAPVPLNGLALQIAVTAQSGKSRFEIRLDPADLGRIDVRVDVDRNGQVTSHLTIEKPETLAMLRQDAPQLQRALDDAGLKTGNGGLQFSLRDQSSGQNQGNDASPNAQRLVINDEDTVPAAIAGRSYGRVLGSNSGVDIRV